LNQLYSNKEQRAFKDQIGYKYESLVILL
jgi:hypothetical protein